MKKTVKVEAIIALAKEEVYHYNKCMDYGEYELARDVRDRMGTLSLCAMYQ